MDEAVPVQRIVGTRVFSKNFRYWGDDTAHRLAGAYKTANGYLAVAVHRGLAALVASAAVRPAPSL